MTSKLAIRFLFLACMPLLEGDILAEVVGYLREPRTDTGSRQV
jgi:hypothetical protein